MNKMLTIFWKIRKTWGKKSNVIKKKTYLGKNEETSIFNVLQFF